MADVLSLFEADCAADVGRAFVTVASEYMTQTRSRGGRVSTLHTAAGLAARFEEPLPKGSRPADALTRRWSAEVIPDSTHLFHPHYAGHQVSAPLPIAVWMEALTAALNQSAAVF